MSKLKDSCCIICNKNITDSSTISIRDHMRPGSNPELSLYSFFQLISNFNQLDISEVPQNACDKCYQDALHVLDFQTLCNKAVENIQACSVDTEHVIVGNECDEDLLYLPEEDTGDGYDIVEIITEKSDNDEDEDIASSPAPVSAMGKRKAGNQANIDRQAERVECGHCHKFFRRNYLHIHNRIHTGERPNKCKLCPKDFKSTTDLKYHMRIHYDERPYFCIVCGAAFRKKHTLDTHTLGHTGEKPYMCEICGKTFNRKGIRDEHYTTHSDTKPFTCSECPKTFGSNKLLKKHMLTHAKIKPIECTFCGKGFMQKNLLKRHQAQHCKGPGNNEASLV